MRNVEQWKPTRYLLKGGRWSPNFSAIYPGSKHIAHLHADTYFPLIQEHLQGALLDCGCGAVPYYGAYKDQIDSVTCVDWEETHGTNPFIDQVVDLNQPLPLEESAFDSVLCSDVFAHIYNQQQLMQEFGRILKPGGKLLLTTPFSYWISEPPHEHFRPSEYALRRMCEDHGLEVIYLEPYGGRMDIMLDMWNKKWTGRISFKLFSLFRRMIMSTPKYRRSRGEEARKFPLGYALVAQKR